MRKGKNKKRGVPRTAPRPPADFYSCGFVFFFFFFLIAQVGESEVVKRRLSAFGHDCRLPLIFYVLSHGAAQGKEVKRLARAPRRRRGCRRGRPYYRRLPRGGGHFGSFLSANSVPRLELVAIVSHRLQMLGGDGKYGCSV